MVPIPKAVQLGVRNSPFMLQAAHDDSGMNVHLGRETADGLSGKTGSTAAKSAVGRLRYQASRCEGIGLTLLLIPVLLFGLDEDPFPAMSDYMT